MREAQLHLGAIAPSQIALGEVLLTGGARDTDAIDAVNWIDPTIADLLAIVAFRLAPPDRPPGTWRPYWEDASYHATLVVGFAQLAIAALPIAVNGRELVAVRARAGLAERGWH